MATPMQSSNTVSLTTGNVAKARKSETPLTRQQETELLVRLGNLLQTTLDIEELLQIFLSELSKALYIDGLKYTDESGAIHLRLGREAVHHCDYRLITPRGKLGEIIFSRNHRLSEQQLKVLETCLGCLIYPLRNALKYRAAIETALRDPLTGAGNRVSMDHTLNRELRLAQRHNLPLSILMIDIDKFKNINDTFGHQTGDEILRHVASTIKNAVRETDMVFRYGGEEFVVLLSDTDIIGSKVIAERIRQHVEDSITEHNDTQVKATVSIGCATRQSNDNVSSLFERADKALYCAKHNGRNQVIASSDISGSTEEENNTQEQQEQAR